MRFATILKAAAVEKRLRPAEKGVGRGLLWRRWSWLRCSRMAMPCQSPRKLFGPF